MSKYILIMKQGGGCVYTIACGTLIIEMDATTPAEAQAEAQLEIDYHGLDRIDEAAIYEVAAKIIFNIEAVKAEREAAEAAEAEAQKEAKDRAELARLQAKYGK